MRPRNQNKKLPYDAVKILEFAAEYEQRARSSDSSIGTNKMVVQYDNIWQLVK